MKLSIIVPVYNVERFLPRCLDSLMRQDIQIGEYEVICINDGSQDRSGIILAEYEAKHPDIFKVITQKNQGVSVARNAGIEIAQGEWIGLADPDDYVINGAYRYLMERFCKDGVDVVSFDYHYIHSDGTDLTYADASLDCKVLFEGDGAEGHNRYPMHFLWTKFYRRTFLQEHALKFKLIYMGDLLFNFQVFNCHPHLINTDCKAYVYELGNNGSVMHIADKPRVLLQMDAQLYGVEYMNRYLQEEGNDMKPAARRCLNIFVDHFYRKAFRVQLTWKEWRQQFGRLKRQPIHRAAETGRTPKRIAILKNLAGCSYLNYLLISNLYRKCLYKS